MRFLVLMLILIGVYTPLASAATEKPNILVVWGDDIGWNNPSAYHRGLMGYKTPNIDRMAAEGRGVVVLGEAAPLLEEVPAAGKTPAELARDLEAELSTYLRDPLVTVIVTGFVGTFREQIRVLGEATSPQALLYNDSMTLLDVMIQTGGLTDFADGNNSTLVRVVDGNQEEYRLRLDDLVRDGDISANVDMRPGDVIIVPEAWF